MHLFLVAIFFTSLCTPFAHAAYSPGDQVDLGFYNENTSGRDLLRKLLNFASPNAKLIEPSSDEEDQLTEEIDELLFLGSEQVLNAPAQDVVPGITQDILFEFLKVVGNKAFAQGGTRAQFLEVIEAAVSPLAASCEIHLYSAATPQSRFGNH